MFIYTKHFSIVEYSFANSKINNNLYVNIVVQLQKEKKPNTILQP